MNYRTCPLCGAHLDFGERCDCVKEAQERRRRMERLFVADSTTWQLRMRLPEKERQRE